MIGRTCLITMLLLAGACRPPAVTSPTEVLWDRWGVPHLFAPDLQSLCYVFGRAQAEAHGDLLLRLYGQARGRGAEYWGETYLDEDKWVRTVGIPERARAWYEAQTPPFRDALDSFARGINDYAEEHEKAIDPELRRVLPVDGQDVLAHLQRVVHFTFVVDRGEVAAAARGLGETRDAGEIGSNAWAIGPSHSASHAAILVANPHLPWGDRFTWFEAQLVTPTVDFSGATLVGLPFLAIGFNDHLGWTHTVNTHDGADLYELQVDGDRYLFDGTWRDLEVRTVTLGVRGENDKTRRESLDIKHSVHGPVVAESGGNALALRLTGLQSPELFAQYWAMAGAHDLLSFETALKRLQMPMFTVMYADRDGYIMHLFGGQVPERPQGDWNWRGVVPGDTSATLWHKTLPYDNLPKAVDPRTGWLQNANDPPWTTTLPSPLDARRFPAYMAPRGMHLRAQQSALLLRGEHRISFDQVVERKHSAQVRAAERLLDDLEAAVGDHGDAKSREALAVLTTWDRQANAGSRGAVLFEAIFRQLRREGLVFAEPWDERRPVDTPDGLTDPRRAAALVSSVARQVESRHGALDVPWGEVYRLRRGELDLPASGGPGALGIFRVLGFEAAEDGTRVATRGDSYVFAVEFGERQRALALLAYGNASQPGSPHVGDQLPLFAAGELRPVWRTRHEIETHLERRDLYGSAER